MLKQAADIDIVHVPFSAGLYTALLGGQIDAMFESMPGPLPHLAAGKLRALAVTGPKRLAALPEVPTLVEQGIGGVDVSSWWGFVGPAGLPRDVVLRLNAAVASALAEPELKAAFARLSIEPSPGTPEAFGIFIAKESARWKETVAKTGLKLE